MVINFFKVLSYYKNSRVRPYGSLHKKERNCYATTTGLFTFNKTNITQFRKLSAKKMTIFLFA